jgi:hypothetical protein
MRRILWTLIAVTSLAWAQEAGTPAKPTVVQKLIQLKYSDPVAMQRLLNLPGINVNAVPGVNAIVIRGTSEAVTEVEEMIKKIDVAPHNIELTVYLLAGTPQAGAEDIPADLASTAKQLHSLFPYKTYRLMQSFVLRDREGHDGSNNGAIPGSKQTYTFHYRGAGVSNGTPRMVHINHLEFSLWTPTIVRDKEGHMIDGHDSVGFNTDIDIGEGQKVVVGKSSANGSDDALILVMSAKVVE